MDQLLASDDPAFRAAVYACAGIGPQQLKIAAEHDGKLILTQAMHNAWVWRTTHGRSVLSDLAWADKNSDRDLWYVNDYNSTEAHFSKLHPEWFLDEGEPDKRPATKEDINSLPERLKPEMIQVIESLATKTDMLLLTETLRKPSNDEAFERLANETVPGAVDLLNELKRSIVAIKGRIGWIWWFSLGALVAASVRHF